MRWVIRLVIPVYIVSAIFIYSQNVCSLVLIAAQNGDSQLFAELISRDGNLGPGVAVFGSGSMMFFGIWRNNPCTE